MKRLRLLLLVCAATGAVAATRTSSGAGLWTDASTWGGAGVPGIGDNVVINHAVTIPDGTTVTVGTRAPATPCCTRPTVAITGAVTTSLSTGAHFVYYTVVDANGESGFSPESASFTVTNGGTAPRVTFPAAPESGQTYNLYSGTSAGAQRLYATGIRSGTYDMEIAESSGAAHPGLGNTAIRINARGGLTVGTSNGATLILQGDVALNNATLTLNGGSTLQWDTTASNVTTAPYVVWWSTAGSQSSAKVTTANSSASKWVTITSAPGGANGRFEVPLGTAGSGQRYTNPGDTTLSYTEITRCGDARSPCFSYMGNDIALSHVTCDGCGKLVYNLFDLNNASARSITIDNVGTYNGVDSAGYALYLNLSPNSTVPTGTRRIVSSSFDMKVWLPQNGLTVTDTYFGNGYTGAGVSNSKTWRSFSRNFVRKTYAADLLAYGDVSDTYWMTDEQTAGNPHFLDPDGGLSRVAFSGNVFEYTGPASAATTNRDVGDAMLHFDRAGITATISHNIVLPNTGGTDSSGTLITLFTGNSSLGEILVHHNTAVMGTTFAAAAINEPNTGTNMALGKLTFRDNILWRPATIASGRRYKVADLKNFSNIPAAPGDFLASADYNSGCNLAASSDQATGTRAAGYWVKSSVPLGTHDVDFSNCTGPDSPGFVDPARNFSKWAKSLGSTGSDAEARADALNKLLHRNDRKGAAAGYTLRALLAYVKAGFVPTSPRLQNAASDGTDIGAAAGQTAPNSPRAAVLDPVIW